MKIFLNRHRLYKVIYLWKSHYRLFCWYLSLDLIQSDHRRLWLLFNVLVVTYLQINGSKNLLHACWLIFSCIWLLILNQAGLPYFFWYHCLLCCCLQITIYLWLGHYYDFQKNQTLSYLTHSCFSLYWLPLSSLLDRVNLSQVDHLKNVIFILNLWFILFTSSIFIRVSPPNVCRDHRCT